MKETEESLLHTAAEIAAGEGFHQQPTTLLTARLLLLGEPVMFSFLYFGLCSKNW